MKLARAGVAAGLAASTALAGVSAAAPKVALLSFADPVRLTPVEGLGGFEPSLTIDRSGNVWATAHETYSPVSVAPDDTSPARGASWLWLSKDGKTFKSPGGLTPAREYQQFAGSEGDVAVDGKGNVYFVDLGPVGVALTSWKVNGPGAVVATYTTPQLPVPLAIDRPFVAAGGDGTLLLTHVGGASREGEGAVRMFVSHDGGRTFDNPLGTGIPNSEHCRPLIDRRNADRMTVLCVPGAGADLITANSIDGGRTWSYGTVPGVYGKDGGQGQNIVFPSLQQGLDGSLVGLHHRFRGGMLPDSVNLVLVRSRDMGRTWTSQDVTPEPGIWEDSSIAVAPDGTLAISGYYRKDKLGPWGFRAATFRPGARDVRSTPVGPVAGYPASETNIPGEYTQGVFGRDGKLRVIYSVRELSDAQAATELENKNLGSSAVFYAQQR